MVQVLKPQLISGYLNLASTRLCLNYFQAPWFPKQYNCSHLAGIHKKALAGMESGFLRFLDISCKASQVARHSCMCKQPDRCITQLHLNRNCKYYETSGAKLVMFMTLKTKRQFKDGFNLSHFINFTAQELRPNFWPLPPGASDLCEACNLSAFCYQ